jgi:signal transduction histidine kinase
VRQLAVELRPSALDDFGLVPALERLSHTFAESTGISVDFHSAVDDRLPPDVETALYRIVQEALTNVVKHARASRVSVVVARKPTSVTAMVDDDGVGGEAASTRDGGLGLVGMRERVALLGGRLTLEMRPDEGTTVLAEVPLT